MGARIRRTVASIGMVLALLSVTAASVVAAPKATDSWSFSQQGYSADASDGDCITIGDVVTCEGMGVNVFSGKTREQGSGAIVGTQVCVYSYTDAFNQATGEPISFTSEFGCTTDLGAGTGIDRDLASATITTTTVTLQSDTCDQVGCTPGGTRDVEVQGTFTGVGSASRTTYRSTYDDGVCTSRDSSRSTSRQSEFVGSVDGQPFEVSGGSENGYSQIGYGSYSYSGRCALE